MDRSATDRPRTARIAQTAREIRRLVLEQAYRAKVGHIGSALSIVDLIATLYTDILRVADPEDPERDRFILSKGHAALAVYAALRLKGWLTQAELDTYCADGSRLGVHPEHIVRGVDFSTGSLGHGLSIGAGAALAARLQQSARRVYVLVSDAECNEGALWEAVMFAAHHDLRNLTALVDVNGQQALGYTREVLDLAPLADRWRAFGWEVSEVDGHDLQAIASALCGAEPAAMTGRPRVVIAHTVFGKGVSYMEGQIQWHYWPMGEAEFRQALQEIDAVA